MEFYVESADGCTAISVDEACERAIGEFLFTPFPGPFRADGL